jgi:hypothetical protein
VGQMRWFAAATDCTGRGAAQTGFSPSVLGQATAGVASSANPSKQPSTLWVVVVKMSGFSHAWTI